MMRKRNGYIMGILLFLLICFVVVSFSRCYSALSEASFLYSEHVRAGNQAYTLHSLKKVCFADAYYWDGSESGMVINVPDEHDGYKVTSLGGFAGSGVPSPFVIYLPYADLVYYRAERLPENAAIHPLCFTINIGKNVDSIGLVAMMRDFLQNETTREFYQILVTINCSEENTTFYSRDGKLYWRADDTLVDDFYYASDYTTE